ncbi:MAG: hypothetical protein IJU12_04045, partial [Clostridia bacterium]|nr:hypothetical protein [Clostridia bacterium]
GFADALAAALWAAVFLYPLGRKPVFCVETSFSLCYNGYVGIDFPRERGYNLKGMVCTCTTQS